MNMIEHIMIYLIDYLLLMLFYQLLIYVTVWFKTAPNLSKSVLKTIIFIHLVINCGPLPSSMNGTWSVFNFTYGNVAFTMCDPGFTHSNTSSGLLICSCDGEWVVDQFVCNGK